MDMVSASCTVNKGDLPINIYWLRNGQKIFSNDGISISRTNQRISILSIESVRDRHAGNYSCVAENKAGLVELSADLWVNGIVPPDKHLQTDWNLIICVPIKKISFENAYPLLIPNLLSRYFASDIIFPLIVCFINILTDNTPVAPNYFQNKHF